jgi:O-antigen/teichoic acid export membrane protein
LDYRKLGKDSLWSLTDFIFAFFIFTLTTKLILNELGQDVYGFYIFFVSIIGTFGLLEIGIGTIIAKYLSEYLPKQKINESNQVITLSVISYSILSIIILLIAIIFAEELLKFAGLDGYFYSKGIKLMPITGIIALTNLFALIPTNVLIAKEKWKTQALLNIVSKSIGLIFLYILLKSSLDRNLILELLLFPILFASLLKIILASYISNKLLILKFERPGSQIRSNFIQYIKPITFQYLLSLLVGHLDKFIVSRFFGLESLGIYSFCEKIISFAYDLMSSVSKLLFPKFAFYHSSGLVKDLKRSLNMSIKANISLSLIFLLSIFLFWETLATLFINQSFALESYSLILLFSFYLVLRSPESSVFFFFNATNRPSELVLNLITYSLVTLPLYFILVPIVGIRSLVIAKMFGLLLVYVRLILKYSKWIFVK